MRSVIQQISFARGIFRVSQFATHRTTSGPSVATAPNTGGFQLCVWEWGACRAVDSAAPLPPFASSGDEEYGQVSSEFQ